MNPRLLLLAFPLLVVAACGDDDAAPTATSPPDATATLPTVPDRTGGAGATFEYATGPDDIVIDVSYEGGFVPPQAVFARTPVAMVTGDGRVLSTGPVIAIFPGPLLPNVLQQSITPAGTQSLLALADQLDLLADVEYERNDQIADANDTVVTITVDGTTYRHQAYALDLEPETDAARANLSTFVAALTDLQSTIGDQLGPDEPFVPPAYLIQATPIDPATMSSDIEPTIAGWPADAPVRLADAATCAELPVADGEAVFADATQLTFFTDADVTYQVAVVQQVPGRSCS